MTDKPPTRAAQAEADPEERTLDPAGTAREHRRSEDTIEPVD